MQYIAFDAHKHYTWVRVERPDGTILREKKIPHEHGALREFLAGCEAGSPVAVETVGNWYWIVDEVEQAGCILQLVHARSDAPTGPRHGDPAVLQWETQAPEDIARRRKAPRLIDYGDEVGVVIAADGHAPHVIPELIIRKHKSLGTCLIFWYVPDADRQQRQGMGVAMEDAVPRQGNNRRAIDVRGYVIHVPLHATLTN